MPAAGEDIDTNGFNPSGRCMRSKCNRHHTLYGACGGGTLPSKTAAPRPCQERPRSQIDTALQAIKDAPFDPVWWRESGPECTRCHVGLEWEGDTPETADDAICHSCAWTELKKLRADLQVALDDTFKLRMEKFTDERDELPVGSRGVDRAAGPSIPPRGGDARGVDVHGVASSLTADSSGHAVDWPTILRARAKGLRERANSMPRTEGGTHALKIAEELGRLCNTYAPKAKHASADGSGQSGGGK